MINRLMNFTRQRRKRDKMKEDSSFRNNYFQLATSWSDDYYHGILSSRNRYKYAFFVSLILCIFLSATVAMMTPLEHLEPLLIHEYADGFVTINHASTTPKNISQAQIESEIVRYIYAREGYDPISYKDQYKLVELLSDPETTNQYQHEQSKENPYSVINTLKNHLIRKVIVESVIFITAKDAVEGNHPYAQVNFLLSDHSKLSQKSRLIPMVATISWKHRGIPDDPEVRWKNWDGFTVTNYQVSQRNSER